MVPDEEDPKKDKKDKKHGGKIRADEPTQATTPAKDFLIQ